MTLVPSSDRKLRVAVLMGGTSSERPISLSTGAMIANALDRDKYLVTTIDTQDILALPEPNPPTRCPSPPGPLSRAAGEGESNALSPPSLVRNERPEKRVEGLGLALDSPSPAARERGPGGEGHRVGGLGADNRPDVVFIALHGKGGEDGTIQGLLELLGLPYTGSGVLASALAMDKAMSKRLFRAVGIPVIDDITVRRGENLSTLCARVEAELGGYPVFVKPNAEGSTFGCALVRTPDELPDAIANALRYDDLALIEKYLRGMEITVGVLESLDTPPQPEALPVIEIVPKSEFYDYESKYVAGGSDHIIPARLSESALRRAREIAIRCHQTLGCRGMSRTDMIVVGDQIRVLEVNTIPGMTPTSLLPQAAEHAGIAFPALLDRLIESALR